MKTTDKRRTFHIKISLTVVFLLFMAGCIGRGPLETTLRQVMQGKDIEPDMLKQVAIQNTTWPTQGWHVMHGMV